MQQKNPKIFISHSTRDKDYVSVIVELLEDLGLNEQQIFCSSISGYGVPMGQDIYGYLKQQFEDHNLYIIFVLSENYYHSVACMNEMGAAWILHNKYTTILLPDFQFKEINGAINPRQVGLKLDSESDDVKVKLGQLKDTILKEFGLQSISYSRWERKRDSFINTIDNLINERQNQDKYKKIFISGCMPEDSEFKQAPFHEFVKKLCKTIINCGYEIYTYYGLGIRDDMSNIGYYDNKISGIVFPQDGSDCIDPNNSKSFRKRLINKVGISLFIYGLKPKDGINQLSDGVREEYEISKSNGNIIVPVGKTGYVAEEIWNELSLNPAYKQKSISDYFQALNDPSIDDEKLIDNIVKYIKAMVEIKKG